MARFEKTRLHVVSAVLIMLGLYSAAGLAYAAWTHSAQSITVWAVIAIVSFFAAWANQVRVAKKRRRTQ